MMAKYCPICGSELAAKITVPETEYAEDGAQLEGTREIAPEGGILVCTGCHAAVAPDDAADVGRATSTEISQKDIEFYPEPHPVHPEEAASEPAPAATPAPPQEPEPQPEPQP
jgi:hypothetical protein